MNIVDMLNQREKEYLSDDATLAINTKGRLHPISQDLMRTEFQRDRDRIIHCKSFRRLMNKTQVFICPEPDHYRTRMTHTLEVTQIARTIARGLRLNEDLVEAAALGHDLGHPPFAHAGERALQKCYDPDFEHAKQSLRVVDVLENNGKGLNLTYEVRDAILNHSGLNQPDIGVAHTLEGKIIRFADKIAYINHDIDDAIRAEIITDEMIPERLKKNIGTTHSMRIENLVSSIITSSQNAHDIIMDSVMFGYMNELREFLFENVYLNPKAKSEESKVEELIIILYHYYLQHPSELPKEILNNEKDSIETRVCDYICGMTDRFALASFNKIFIPKVWNKY